MSKANFFIHFQFLGLETEFYALSQEVKQKAREDFLTSLDVVKTRESIISYSLSGIRADCDMLLLRVTEHLDSLQSIFERMRSAGMGKYLDPEYTYLATCETKPIDLGKLEYLFVCPWGRTKEWYALTSKERDKRLIEEKQIVMRKPSLQLHIFDSFGMEGQETILVCETSQPRDFLEIVKELKGTPVAYFLPVASTFLGVKKDIRDIIEGLG